MAKRGFGFTVNKELGSGTLARAGAISTPHGDIQTPAFIVVGTKAAVRGMLPEQVRSVGAQAVLANAYHLYLSPGAAVVEEAGGLSRFMGWPGPTFTDSGGFQVLSLGSGFKKMLAMDTGGVAAEQVIASEHARQAIVDDDGVTFKSHIDGSSHRFNPEVSMRVQRAIGADIIFAFDECTSLMHSYDYQQQSLKRTEEWADRCLQEHARLSVKDQPYQALYGVVQGAQYEDLRRQAARHMAELPFDGYGIGGAFEKNRLSTIVRWVNDELPKSKPRHLLGLSEPDDIFAGIEQGADTFDCVQPTRLGRHGTAYTLRGRISLTNAGCRRDFSPIEKDCPCYTCQNFTKAYLHHLFRSREALSATLASIHNEQFVVGLVDQIRASILDGSFFDFKTAWLARYYRR